MKLTEIKKDKDDTRKGGTYAGYRFNKDDVDNLLKWVSENNIPNQVDDIHCTLLYSKKPCPDYNPLGNLKQPFTVGLSKPKNWTHTPDSEGVLVFELDAPEMVKRHKELMKEHDASYDFDEYVPHITISYNVGKDFDVSKLSPLPSNTRKLQVIEEYAEQLDEEWKDD